MITTRHTWIPGVAAFLVAATIGYAQSPIYTITFNSASDATAFNTETTGGATASFVAGDAPAGQSLSTGALLMTMPAGGSWYYVAEYFNTPQNLSAATTFSLWYKIVQGDTGGGINSLQPIIKDNSNGWDESTYTPGISGTGWTYWSMPASDFPEPGTSINAADGYIQSIWDGSVGASGLQIEFDNIQWSGAPVPEPATLALCGIGGLLGLFMVRRKS